MTDVVDLTAKRRVKALDAAFAGLVVLTVPEDGTLPRAKVTAPGYKVVVNNADGAEAYMLWCETGRDDEMVDGMIPRDDEREQIVNALCETLLSLGYRVDIYGKSDGTHRVLSGITPMTARSAGHIDRMTAAAAGEIEDPAAGLRRERN